LPFAGPWQPARADTGPSGAPSPSTARNCDENATLPTWGSPVIGVLRVRPDAKPRIGSLDLIRQPVASQLGLGPCGPTLAAASRVNAKGGYPLRARVKSRGRRVLRTDRSRPSQPGTAHVIPFDLAPYRERGVLPAVAHGNSSPASSVCSPIQAIRIPSPSSMPSSSLISSDSSLDSEGPLAHAGRRSQPRAFGPTQENPIHQSTKSSRFSSWVLGL
jgi:hypothetical protein